MTTRRLAVGCEFTYEAAVRTPAVFQVTPGDSRLVTRRSESWLSTPDLSLRSYRDLYGNPCTRVVLPAGWSTLRYSAEVEVYDATEDVDESAPEIAAEQLPDDTLIYTLPSRYCLPDVLADEAWTLFGAQPPGYADRCDLQPRQLSSDFPIRRFECTVDGRRCQQQSARRLPGLHSSGHHVLSRPEHPGEIRVRLPPGHGRTGRSGADGFRSLDGGLAGRPLVDLRPAEQQAPQGACGDRAWTGRLGRRDGHHLRRPAAQPDDGAGAGDLTARDRIGRPADHLERAV